MLPCKHRRAFACAVLAASAVPAVGSTLSFTEVPVPVANADGSDAQKRAVLTSPSVRLDGHKVDIGYKTIMRSGQGLDIRGKDGIRHTQLPFGTLVDNRGRPIAAADRGGYGATPSAVDGSPFLSNDNDFSSLIPYDDRLFMISHFESRPGTMYLSGLHQDRESGGLTALWTRPIDFSAVRGGWAHCAGSVTPWNTHLGSEEYEPDARLVEPATGRKVTDAGSPDDYYHAMAEYFQGDRTRVNPYDYGYPVEVSIANAEGDTRVVKHYGMGRISLELAYVMPDAKTVYLTDDGRFTGLYMFVADRPGDLRAGTLYAARWDQTSADALGLGEARLSWIGLGHAADADIEGYLRGEAKLTFADIFDAYTPTNAACEDGYQLVFKGHRKTAGGTYAECLKLKDGMATAASRLETRRYAAIMGATTEFTKEEGITFDPDMNRLYIAMSDVTDGMLNRDADETFKGAPGPNHVRVAENRCGAVYAADIASREATVRDTGNRPIRSRYVAVNMYPLVAGKQVNYEGTVYEGNRCDVHGIANPDNIAYLPGYGTLIIGEDTDRHQNNMVWSYDTASGTLARIQTTPYGSETTSVYWFPNINGFGYLMSVVQHPFVNSDWSRYVSGSSADRGYTGYIGPFPALD